MPNPFTLRLALLAAMLLLSPTALRADGPPFVPLFDGKSLDGWKKAGGGATYRVEEECLVGEVGPGRNTFLCTEKTYGDFRLKLQYKLDVPGNSGVQFRSHVREKDGVVFGYQCEIDPSARAWSAGIYDESRRGWLFPLDNDEKARKALKLDDWNDLVIEAVGPRNRTWLNGVPCADLVDTADLEGLIALQVHSGEKGRIRWRKIELKDLGVSKWQPLWNGKDLDGWETIGGGKWAVDDGALRGTSTKNEPRHGHLITKRKFSDFAVRLKFRSIQGNSGLYFRVEQGGAAGVQGFQAEIDPAVDVGGLYETSGRAWVVRPTAEEVKKFYNAGQWNEMSVVGIGGRIVVHVNGRKTAELTDDPGRSEGFIALQLHGGQDMDVAFKDVEWLDLAKPAGK
ncbi:MAG: DUF1080 domain-containing protein [Planctomycetia bacterium]|nr:DUF1080 domain-containing protein [Planctomycetia bacterium]